MYYRNARDSGSSPSDFSVSSTLVSIYWDTGNSEGNREKERGGHPGTEFYSATEHQADEIITRVGRDMLPACDERIAVVHLHKKLSPVPYAESGGY